MIKKEFKEIDNIKIFHENIEESHGDFNAKGLDSLYSSEEKHFWFITRKKYILNNIKNLIDKNSKLIEIGAGTGNVSRFLQKNGYNNICVGEMHINGLKYAQSYGIKNCFQFDLLDSPFENEFDVVCMFDVLEHIQDDDLALKNIYNTLNQEGSLILTVPSHMWLWSREDSIAGHKIRYTKKQLVEKLENNGFEVLTARYFFIFITPLLLLRKILYPDNYTTVTQEEYNQDITISPTINKILIFLCNVENKISRFLPNLFGGSLFILARKKQ